MGGWDESCFVMLDVCSQSRHRSIHVSIRALAGKVYRVRATNSMRPGGLCTSRTPNECNLQPLERVSRGRLICNCQMKIMQSLHTYTYVKSKSSSIVIMRRPCWTPLSASLSTPDQGIRHLQLQQIRRPQAKPRQLS
jgi:hypothetical protein